MYIYRSGSLGKGLKKDVWLDDNCIGETASKVFFYQEISANGTEHNISTESEFSANHLLLKAESGKTTLLNNT